MKTHRAHSNLPNAIASTGSEDFQYLTVEKRAKLGAGWRFGRLQSMISWPVAVVPVVVGIAHIGKTTSLALQTKNKRKRKGMGCYSPPPLVYIPPMTLRHPPIRPHLLMVP